MARSALLALAVAALAGCATARPRAEDAPPRAAPAPPPAGDAAAQPPRDLPEPAREAAVDERAADGRLEARPRQREGARPPAGAGARIAARARSFLGRRGPFQVGRERFNGDCSGFVAAVYAAEGVDLRAAMQRVAPAERRGARAAWLAAGALGSTFGAEASPAPGDLAFWHDTYDRNRNRRRDDRFTHVGIVERVDALGSVHFIHRGGKGVARGVMTLARPHEATAPDGRRLNSPLRARAHAPSRQKLASELFAGFGSLDGEPRQAGAATGGARARRPAPQARAPERTPGRQGR